MDKLLQRFYVRINDHETVPEELVLELLNTAIDRINLRVGDTEFNPLFNSIAIDIAMKMYRRLYFEGIASEKADTLTTNFVENILDEYGSELDSYKKDRLALKTKKVVRFL